MFKAVVSGEMGGRGLAVASVSTATVRPQREHESIYTVAYATVLLGYVHWSLRQRASRRRKAAER